jgi:hypothetical protein
VVADVRRTALLAVPLLAAGLGLVAGCGGGGASSGHVCWGYSASSGVVYRTVNKLNAGCGSQAALYAPGGPFTGTSAQPAGVVCTVRFPSIVWEVWDADSTGYGRSLCAVLRDDPK